MAVARAPIEGLPYVATCIGIVAAAATTSTAASVVAQRRGRECRCGQSPTVLTYFVPCWIFKAHTFHHKSTTYLKGSYFAIFVKSLLCRTAALALDGVTPFDCLDWRDFTADINSVVLSLHDISGSIMVLGGSEGGGGELWLTKVCPLLPWYREYTFVFSSEPLLVLLRLANIGNGFHVIKHQYFSFVRCFFVVWFYLKQHKD